LKAACPSSITSSSSTATLPDEWKLNSWTTKRALRESMKGCSPTPFNRPRWASRAVCQLDARRVDSVTREVLLDRGSRERGLIDPQAVDSCCAITPPAMQRRPRLWTLLNLELARTFIDGNGVQTLPVAPLGSSALLPARRRRSWFARRRPAPPKNRLMRILWLKSDLLLPLDKGGKLRTWHLMRHLAAPWDRTSRSRARASRRPTSSA
jgi:hypothetical protein